MSGDDRRCLSPTPGQYRTDRARFRMNLFRLRHAPSLIDRPVNLRKLHFASGTSPSRYHAHDLRGIAPDRFRRQTPSRERPIFLSGGTGGACAKSRLLFCCAQLFLAALGRPGGRLAPCSAARVRRGRGSAVVCKPTAVSPLTENDFSSHIDFSPFKAYNQYIPSSHGACCDVTT